MTAQPADDNVTPMPQMRGVRKTGPKDSALEAKFWAAYMADSQRWPALRGMRKQVEITAGSRRRVDLLLPDHIAIELNSQMYHSSPEQMTDDFIRETQLLRAGYIVISVAGKIAWNDPEITLYHISLAVENIRKHWKRVKFAA
jgi:very-short-patch-repair endonuclease